MKINFERTGGFTAIPFRANLDTDSMPPDQAREVEDLVRQADFFNLPASIESGGPAGTPGADRFQYKISVESQGRTHTVRTTEVSAPEELLPLIDYLEAAARDTEP